jgi:Zn-dependent peptidase ImmA (M78 family)
MDNNTVGDRVRESIPPSLSQRRLAPEVGMTHDALSRAINGQRHFAVVELAAIAERLGVDTHWLITGQHDPFRVRLAARHPWGQESAEQEQSDDAIISRVVQAYRAAYRDVGHTPGTVSSIPADPTRLRTLLAEGVADGSARSLADQVTAVLGVDIVRDPGLRTDYSFRIGDHAVVLLKSTIYWFRANWSIAHELAHLALGHHVDDRAPLADEIPANNFAGEFLLPEDGIRDINWQSMTTRQLALWLWEAGVSTTALAKRLEHLSITTSDEVRAALSDSTPKLMRAHIDSIRAELSAAPLADPIWDRENATTGRQFPAHVVAALSERVEVGEVDPHLLAWVREVPVDDLSWPEPDVDAPSSDYAELEAKRTRPTGLLCSMRRTTQAP